ncbi:L-serine ammonia-lyase, iron-sulfur-dependent subunit beta [Rummeliibacillus sp. G93]|uniref:L-serine deaminase n=1 Tax=Rummeliibacillus stabekisii TaxID=241244 RepID=A0A143HA37_9BACL|nr:MULTISPECIES: L-serine ammonia-lyase, iron-sulfur-dependent subunit beta [Rummeliibacillus]AMW98386.1 serine dehydratase [Rummeliibacillus stabekisii]MBB5169920.1 L-serine dehydratase [Rummeliibacillus stabekisii]UQW98346.1 L-serine ammonia-lyase, iron-sulfur-dependent subunit beta [Rummeliibacillus sp. G93]GEL04178.1 putative L-serine dehydratase, beta chain [Rummeliibacillus stabekisii]
MKYTSVFDIIGPVMIGPSSSHTAGAARIGRVARDLFGRLPKWAKIHLYGSFAETYKGHGTDVAIIGGLLDYETYDERIKTAFQDAKNAGLEFEFIPETDHTEHPNTARIVIGDDETEMSIVGISIGGGTIEITELNGFPLRLSGGMPAILVVHNDRAGCIANVAKCLAEYDINIGHMEVSRKERGNMALMVIEIDQNIDQSIMEEIELLPNITKVTRIKK